ncbi:3-hydroxylacyl-ACP dehydratase [Acidocella aromatica]|uniref:3-hydroxymyristoyl/3-hydroxydecanoyl-(Acyl carrier protein) dehydratase n=1 Tax=Acidocella aromatica TaxID=1303579 RepID=A0A840VGA3_9PROT|nr:3-hydroxylacyl-ACP dehydratase [Acidocella aromatica]MBB5373927.1 3-hydroxymyristoyl/3-hydroxydecanoyl-(acyl carrier protein) dehydratase [Acidocella aromatica]
MTNWQTQALTIPANHPSAAGHFPGNPIIAGALLLDAALDAMGVTGGAVIRGAKFLRPVRPGTALELRWQPAGEKLLRFEYLAAGELAASGTVALA